MPLRERFYAGLHYSLASLVKLNVYTETHDDPPNVRRNQILSTRVFLISILLAMIGLTGYTAQMQTLTVEVNNPSQYDYERLEKLYPNTLTCPCSRLTIPAGSFVTVNATFHQVCFSDFVTDAWVAHLASDNPTALYYPLDIRSSASSQFQQLATLCSSSQEAVSNELASFATSELITPVMLSRSAFDAQAGLLIADSRVNLLDQQQRMILLILAVNEQNQLPTAIGTSFLYATYNDINRRLNFVRYPLVNSTNMSCSCQSSFNCVYPAGIYSNLSGSDAFTERGLLQASHEPDMTLEGMLVGCVPLNTLLQSTLECLYNSTCLSKLQSHLTTGPPLTVVPLLVDARSHFPPQTLVQTLLDELMVEEWTNTSNYSSFYEQCNPTTCTYLHQSRLNAVLIFSSIIALFGGLSVGLKLGTMIIVAAYRIIQRKIMTINSAEINTPGSAPGRKLTEHSFHEKEAFGC